MRFSVIVPSFARPRQLTRCLEALSKLNYACDQFEVIVIDDGSPEDLNSTVNSFQQKLRVSLLKQPHAGPASARNLGAGVAKGELLAFLDDDCIPRPLWLHELDRAAQQFPEALLGGATTNGCPENIFAATNQLLIDTVRAWLRASASPLDFFPSNNLAAPTEAFREIAGFDDTIKLAASEDRDLCARWLDSGRSLVDVPGAQVEHCHSQTFVSFLKMHFRYGRGAALLHRRRKTNPLRFAGQGLYWGLLRAGLHAQACKSRFIATLLLTLSQVSSAAGYLFQATRSS